ncbi:MAG: DUF3109 family protein [Planctomycetota bacterium]|nr:DUF3109 family protein [Planctomycetota bacterium]
MKPLPVVVENASSARFECVFPTCGGICCKNGRPPVEPAEERRIQANLRKFLPHLRPAARRRVEREGFMTRRVKEGLHTLAVSEGWCVFEHGGCVLHKVGLEEGEAFKYKPWRCAVFPYERLDDDRWYVRQWGAHGEIWDLFCLDPKASPKKAVDTSKGELALLRELTPEGKEGWRFKTPRGWKPARPGDDRRS